MNEAEKKTYSQQEKLFLISVIDKYKSILENKKTDAVNIQKKQETWKKITDSYNSNFVYRTTKQLKKLWDNLKQRTRKADSDLKHSILITGGGPAPEDDNDPINDLVRSVVPSINVEVKNNWDSVGILESDKSADVILEDQYFIDDYNITIDEQENLRNLEANKETVLNMPHNSRTPLSPHNIEIALNTPKKADNPVNNTTGSTKKRKLSQTSSGERINISEESSLRIKKIKESITQQEELHKLKMDVARAEKMYWEKKLSMIS